MAPAISPAARTIRSWTSTKAPWRVRWDDDVHGVPQVAWEAEEDGKLQRVFHEPRAALWRRALSRLFSAFVPEALL